MGLQHYVFGYLNDNFESVEAHEPLAELFYEFLVDVETRLLYFDLEVVVAHKLQHLDVDRQFHEDLESLDKTLLLGEAWVDDNAAVAPYLEVKLVV